MVVMAVATTVGAMAASTARHYAGGSNLGYDKFCHSFPRSAEAG